MLTHRKEKFIKYIMLGNNPTESARLAGYSVNGTAQIASRLIRDADVVKALESFREEQKAKLSRENYVSKALGDYNSLPVDSSNRTRNLEIVGKALGYLGNDSSKNNNSTNTVNVQINSVSLESKSTQELWDIARKLLSNETS